MNCCNQDYNQGRNCPERKNMTEEERNLDLIIGDLQKENRLLKARNEQLENRDFTEEELKKMWHLLNNIVSWYTFEEVAKLIIKKMKDA